MIRFSKTSSERRLERIALGRDAALVTQFWLKRWQAEDRLPVWDDGFGLADMAGLRNAIAIHEIRADGRFHCHYWGDMLTLGAGADLTEKDLLVFTPPEQRATRRERYNKIADGCIGHGLKEAVHKSGFEEMTEEIMLPFDPAREDGSRFVMYFVNWRASRYDNVKPEITNAFNIAVEFEFIALDPEP